MVNDKTLEMLIRKNLIKIKTSDCRLPRTCFDFDGMRFIIEIPDKIKQEDIEKAINHEIAHIIRLDMFVDKEFNPILANICQDIVVNTILGITNLEIDGNVIQGYNWDSVKDFPNIPHWSNGWKALYNYFEQQCKSRGIDILNELTTGDYVFDEMDDETKELIKQAAEKLRQAIVIDGRNHNDKLREEMIKVLKDAIKKEVKLPQNYASHTIDASSYIAQISKKDPFLLKLVKRIVRHGTSNNHTKKINRSYRREPIVEGFARRLPLPSKTILFIIDTSGSYIRESEAIIIPAILYISKHFPTKLLTFDTSVYEAKIHNSISYKGGGGTLFKPVIEHLQNHDANYNAIIFISDYEFFDVNYDKEKVKKELSKFSKYVFTLDYREINGKGK